MISDAINGLCDRFLKAPVIGPILVSPIYSAILITIIIVLIAAYVFTDEYDSVMSASFKSGFYIFIAMLIFMLTHDRVLKDELTYSEARTNVTQIHNLQDNILVDDTIVPVHLDGLDL